MVEGRLKIVRRMEDGKVIRENGRGKIKDC